MRERANNIDNPVFLEGVKESPYVAYDIYSKLLAERIIFLGEDIDDDTSNVIVSELLILDSINHNPIKLYINSPGGNVTSGLAIYDAMKLVKSPVHVWCLGQAASMAAILLSAGEKGHRYILPNARVMIHQPSGGTVGKVTDILIAANEIQRIRENLNELLAENTGQSLAKVSLDTESDNWMTAEEAVEYGLVDKVLNYE